MVWRSRYVRSLNGLWRADYKDQFLLGNHQLRYPLTTTDYRQPQIPEYPFHDRTLRVTPCGRHRMGRRKVKIGKVYGGQHVGIRAVADEIWLVSFMDYDLGFFGAIQNRVEPIGDNLFACKWRNRPKVAIAD